MTAVWGQYGEPAAGSARVIALLKSDITLSNKVYLRWVQYIVGYDPWVAFMLTL